MVLKTSFTFDCVQAPLVSDLWFLWCSLVDFRQEALQLGPVAHQLVVDPVSFVQQGVDVGHGLITKQYIESSDVPDHGSIRVIKP